MYPVTSLYLATPLSANTILDLSLSRIKTKQHSDLDILPIFNSLRTAPSDLQFALQDDVLFHLLPPYNTATFFRVLFLLKSLVSRGPHTYHDHPLSGYLDVHRTLTDILSRSWWPHLRQSVQNYIVSCTKRVCHNIVCTKLDGHLTREHPQLSNRFFKEIYLFLGYQLCLIPKMGMRTTLRTFYGGFLENRYSRVKSIFFIILFFRPNQALEHVKLCIEMYFRFTK